MIAPAEDPSKTRGGLPFVCRSLNAVATCCTARLPLAPASARMHTVPAASDAWGGEHVECMCGDLCEDVSVHCSVLACHHGELLSDVSHTL